MKADALPDRRPAVVCWCGVFLLRGPVVVKVAILIAVESFADGQIVQAAYAEADVLRLAAVLDWQGFAAADRVVLLSQDATKQGIESRVRRVLKGIEPEDELLVYYVGNGFSQLDESYLMCQDTDPRHLAETSLPLAWLIDRFRESDCRKLTLLLDVRQSGEAAVGDENAPCGSIGYRQLEQFFSEADRGVCLAACLSGETSYVSNTLKQGIWAFYLAEAFEGTIAAAFNSEGCLSADALQRYLQREVLRTLAVTYASRKEQTPWLVGAATDSHEFAVSLKPLERRERNGRPQNPAENTTLFVERSQGIRTFSAFKKGYRLPDRVSHAAEAFVAKIAGDDIASDVQRVFAALKQAFRFKRADLQVSSVGDGTATIVTPLFNYSIVAALDPADPSQVTIRRSVDAIKDAKAVLSEKFATVFPNVFDTLQFEPPQRLDLAEIIDRLEEQDDPRISLDYDPGLTWCNVNLAGLDGVIRMTERSIAIVHAKPQPPRNLLQSFFALQQRLFGEGDWRRISRG